jgi:hypothetical protein
MTVPSCSAVLLPVVPVLAAGGGGFAAKFAQLVAVAVEVGFAALQWRKFGHLLLYCI